eukprot:scaffold155_cov347-Pavlova_lutheri.AAC.6
MAGGKGGPPRGRMGRTVSRVTKGAEDPWRGGGQQGGDRDPLRGQGWARGSKIWRRPSTETSTSAAEDNKKDESDSSAGMGVSRHLGPPRPPGLLLFAIRSIFDSQSKYCSTRRWIRECDRRG